MQGCSGQQVIFKRSTNEGELLTTSGRVNVLDVSP